MDAPQYPGYPPQYWYPQTHNSGHYESFQSGSEGQFNPQVLPGSYPPSSFHPSNPFYCADPQRGGPGSFPSQGGPTEQSGGASGQHHYPGPPCPGGAGFPAGPYPHYPDSSHAMPPNPPYPTGPPLHPSPQVEAWPQSGGYASPQQQWQPGQQPPTQNHYGAPVRPAHPPAWPGTGTGAPPPYQPKDHQHHRAPHVGPKPRPTPSQKPSNGKPAEISAPPQMYNQTRRGEPHPSAGEPPAQAPPPGGPGPRAPSPPPGLAVVQQVLGRVQLLQEDVDEFVGRKSDRGYRVLEELLTKELLLLDAVETGGRDSVRHARREGVQRIQAILDRLEKKAF
ncbi:BAG family molecular chaperone regulator 4 isoform X2 [Antennarius striatus]|uniref:BAG family molecular chaperone regulator 4 isoform X2 n=1 Tax=Antennarius striatus TaxID=241820 RepID=UPI0035AF0765